MITCLTGAILVFESELQQAFFKQRYFVTVTGNPLTADSLVRSVKEKMPEAKISGIKIYTDRQRTAEITLTQPGAKKKEQANEGGKKEARPKGPEGNRLTAFVNPYTGEVAEIYNHRKSFFYFVMNLHRWMLGGEVGKMVVGICTLIFLFILITGIILWWPKNKQVLQQRLKIKRGVGFKRLNHDYHVVPGFYTSIFLFVFAFTALAWSFEWFNKGIYTITGSSMERPKAPTGIVKDSTQKILIEAALQTVVAQNNNAVYYNIALPKDSTDSYAINILSREAAHETATDTYFVNAFAPTINGVQKFADRNTGQKVRATFRPIHVASIYGTPSKIIGFAACLLGTFFPASGIIMWFNRTKKKKKNVI
jgi:uncharacterized iron-regulated membrane protein